MEIRDWQGRWASGQIGFHEAQANAFLREHASLLSPAGRVLVPLCGKSRDLTYLASQGHDVVGVEGVEMAVDAYFAEAGETPTCGAAGALPMVSAGPVGIVVGSFFDVRASDVEPCDHAYDRAALIAVDPGERERYVAKLRELVRPGGKILLVGFSYDQTTMSGPPWSLGDDDITRLFAGSKLDKLAEKDVTEESGRLRERGATWVREAAFLVTT